MYCGTCGAPIEDGASFCGKCGNAVETKESEETANLENGAVAFQPEVAVEASGNMHLTYESDFGNASTAQHEAPASPAAFTPDQTAFNAGTIPTPETTAPAKRKPVVPIVVSIVAIIALVAIGIYAFSQNQQQAYERDHAEHPLELGISGIDLQAETPVIPVSISGTDLDGSSVSITSIVEPGKTTPSLMQGAYTLTFPSCAIASNGSVYMAPTNSTFFSISNELEPDEPCQVVIDQPFSQLNPIDVTDEMLENASSYIKHGPDGAQLANELVTLAIDKRTEAQEAKRIADEEAARKAAEEAERQRREQLIASRTAVTGTFGGEGMSAGNTINLAVDGDVLIVTGTIHAITNGSYSGTSLLSQMRLILTSSTTYGYVTGIGRSYESRSEFISSSLPNHFPAVTFIVKDGYVTDIYTHS